MENNVFFVLFIRIRRGMGHGYHGFLGKHMKGEDTSRASLLPSELSDQLY